MKYILRSLLQVVFFVLLILKLVIIIGLFLHRITLNRIELILCTLLFLVIIIYVYLYPLKRYEYGLKELISLNNKIVRFARNKIFICFDVIILMLIWCINILSEIGINMHVVNIVSLL